jgi:hypothetical protein
MTATDIERVLVQTRFAFRRWLVVPNVAWGFHIHECDLLAISGSGYIHEVEIKISAADLKRDSKKYHGHRDNRVACLWFAVPAELGALTLELAPARAGVICIRETIEYGHRVVDEVRKAQRNPTAKPMTVEQRLAVARLGVMRYWARISA